MADTLRGIPIRDEWAWVILILAHGDGHWFPATWTAARTRRQAIARFEEIVGGDPYAVMRRRGRARAVRCRIEPCTFGEDRRKAATHG